VLDLRQDARSGRRLGSDGQEVEAECEHDDEDDRPHELRDDGGRQPAHRDEAVAQASFLQRGDDSAEDPERHDEQEGQEGELGGLLERGADDVAYGPPLRVGLAEVSLRDPADPVDVPDDDAAVRAELFVQRLDCGGVGEGAEDATTDVARQNLRAQEDDDAQKPERYERKGKPFCEKRSDLPTSGATAR